MNPSDETVQIAIWGEIDNLLEKVKLAKQAAGVSEKGRLLAIAATHLETAKLFAREAGE